jgi:crossover junction endodeoxyribonuclease RusA
LTVTIPTRTQSLSNVRWHWAKKAGYVKAQRTEAFVECRNARLHVEKGWHITLTRIAPRRLDDGNLGAALKAIQDGVADAVGVDDRHIHWTYEQEKGKPGEYGVRVEVRNGQR